LFKVYNLADSRIEGKIRWPAMHPMWEKIPI
jgi:hypothetical protein